MALLTQASGRRMAYHLDGSQVSWWINSGTKYTATQTNLNNINDDEFTSDSIDLGTHVANATINVVFPAKRNIYQYFLFIASNNTAYNSSFGGIYVSTDTTDGSNGTWVSITTPTPNGYLGLKNALDYNLNATEWFDNVYVSGVLNGATEIKGIRFYFTCFDSSVVHFYVKSLNLYGEINDSTAIQRVAWTDNAGASLTTDKAFTTIKGDTNIISGQYLKNLYTNATSQIVFSIDGEITIVNSNVTISVDGGTNYYALPYTWTTSLASGAVSSEIKVKYLPTTETLGLKYYGITATPTFV